MEGKGWGGIERYGRKGEGAVGKGGKWKGKEGNGRDGKTRGMDGKGR